MGVKLVNIFFLLGIAAIMSCASSGSASRSGAGGDHYEDLSAYRPNYENALDTMATEEEAVEGNIIIEDVDPQYDVTAEVNSLLDSINILKKDVEYVEGYTIQVYTGIKKEEANQAKAAVYEILEDSRPIITYEQPNFKVKVGKFYTRREALRTFAELKKELPSAIILPEKIPVGSNE